MSNILSSEIIVIGGSAGSFNVFMQIIKELPDDFVLPLIIVIHRQKNSVSEFTKILVEANENKKILEPDDKEAIHNSCVYIAPQNYHLLIEKNYTLSLDYSEAIKFSRPSIDVTFESAASVYKNNLIAILLSGANNDGSAGMQKVVSNGGIAIAQDPATADFPAMPLSAISSVKGVKVLNPAGIISFIIHANNTK